MEINDIGRFINTEFITELRWIDPRITCKNLANVTESNRLKVSLNFAMNFFHIKLGSLTISFEVKLNYPNSML